MTKLGNKFIIFKNNFTNKESFYFNIYNRLAWNIERLIWIAYFKNINNKYCLIDGLPKDIIKYIIQLLSTFTFYENNKNEMTEPKISYFKSESKTTETSQTVSEQRAEPIASPTNENHQSYKCDCCTIV